MNKKHHDRVDIVYSTDPEYKYNYGETFQQETLPPPKQDLRVSLDRKQRGGKVVTLVTGFKGQEDDLETLCKLLKTKCGTGGSAKEGEIIIQGDQRDKVIGYLSGAGYKVKKSGG
jgi:translation initiation factor 1